MDAAQLLFHRGHPLVERGDRLLPRLGRGADQPARPGT